LVPPADLFARHEGVPGHVQEALTNARTVIVGAGGLGSWVALALARSGARELVDHRSGAILRHGEYTCALRDGAVVQITYALDGNQLLRHRFCWIPAPIAIDRDDLNETDLAELVDQGLEGAGLRVLDDDTVGEDLLLVAPMRFYCRNHCNRSSRRWRWSNH